MYEGHMDLSWLGQVYKELEWNLCPCKEWELHKIISIIQQKEYGPTGIFKEHDA